MSSLFLFLTFIFLSVTIFLLFYSNRRMIFTKIMVTIIMIAVSSLILSSFDSFKGWPLDNKVCNVSIVWAKVVNPSTTVQEGKIYVLGKSLDKQEKTWYSDLFYTYDGAESPRLYSFPYTEKGKSIFTKVMVALKMSEGLNLTCNPVSEEEQKGGKTKGGQAIIGGTKDFTIEELNPMELLPKPN